MSSPVALILGVGLLAGGVAVAFWWLDEPERAIPGVLLSVGPAAKAAPYAVAQGAVTHGEAVLIDFGDGDFAFFVNRSDDVRALINGCGERVAPVRHERFPLLVDARFHVRNVPPYLVEARSARYLFDLHASPSFSDCR
ncbi:MAG: hypothetical protein AB1451_04845 [Nitrospirota bacterium]